MHDVFYWLTGNELEAHRIIYQEYHNYKDVEKSVARYRDAYNDLDAPLPDILNGYVEYNGEMVCISCLYGWIYEFGIVEPANYVRYTGMCHMICSQCDTIIQPWKD